MARTDNYEKICRMREAIAKQRKIVDAFCLVIFVRRKWNKHEGRTKTTKEEDYTVVIICKLGID